jgi:hypothetical protein
MAMISNLVVSRPTARAQQLAASTISCSGAERSAADRTEAGPGRRTAREMFDARAHAMGVLARSIAPDVDR